MATMVVTQCSMAGVAACFLALFSFGSVLESAAAEDTGMIEQDYDINNCPGTNLPNYLANIAMSENYATKELSFSADMVVSDRILPGTEMHFTYNKCIARDDVNSCTKNSEKSVNDLCDKLTAKNRSWTTLIEGMQREGFEPECPTKPGNFSVKDVVVPPVALDQDEKYKGYWMLKVEVWNGDTMHFCVEMKSVLAKSRRKRKKTRPTQ